MIGRPYDHDVKLATSGEIRRIDISPLLDLLPPLREEWATLEFDSSGYVVNPLTREPIDQFTLVAGRHLQARAVYRARLRVPRLEVPEHRAAELDDELCQLVDRKASRVEMREHARRRREASSVIGVDEVVATVVLLDDDAGRLACKITQEHDRWSVDVAIDEARLPRIELSGRIDLTAALRAEGLPGFLAGLLGGSGEGQGQVDLSHLEGPSGRLVEASGRANRFTGSGNVDVNALLTSWQVEGTVTLQGHGLGRLAILVGRRAIRKSMARQLAQLWDSKESWTSDFEQYIEELKQAVEAAGGAANFVHRSLWDPGFRSGFPSPSS